MNSTHIHNRLKWAKSKIKYTSEKLERIVFIDEKKLKLYKDGDGENAFVKCTKNSRLK